MEKGLMFGPTDRYLKATLSTDANMDKAVGTPEEMNLERLTQASTRTTKNVASESTYGLTVLGMKVNSRTIKGTLQF